MFCVGISNSAAKCRGPRLLLTLARFDLTKFATLRLYHLTFTALKEHSFAWPPFQHLSSSQFLE